MNLPHSDFGALAIGIEVEILFCFFLKTKKIETDSPAACGLLKKLKKQSKLFQFT